VTVTGEGLRSLGGEVFGDTTPFSFGSVRIKVYVEAVREGNPGILTVVLGATHGPLG